jgi:hypothetical protein
MPSPSLVLEMFPRSTLLSESASSEMPVPRDSLALLASSLLPLALLSERPPVLDRTSLPSTTLSRV